MLDVGSLDINSANRCLFRPFVLRRCTYIDLGPSPNVDVVCPVHLHDAADRSFDVIVSTEAFEHDRDLAESPRNIVRLLRPGGLSFFTCAATGRPQQGTTRTTPTDSPHRTDFYRSVPEDHVCAALDVDAISEQCEFSVEDATHDLRFRGISR